jgi:hypothetical protein
MRSRLVLGRWQRAAVLAGAVLLTGPMLAGEVVHLGWWGHPGLGLHLDNNGYSIWGVNLTPLPLLVHVCDERGDAGTAMQFRYRMEKLSNDSPRWIQGPALWERCDSFGQPAWRIWWPGASLQLVRTQSWEDLGSMEVRAGDRVRFVVFTIYDWPDDSWLQVRMVSPARAVDHLPGARPR